jgi:hypothetical protein
MPTMNMPSKKREADDSDPLLASQRRPKQERYRLQVDRQTKASFSTIDSAEKAGAVIKKRYAVVKVTIYDVQSNATKVIE